MSICVQKYGGSALKDTFSIQKIALLIKQYYSNKQLIIVVSAPEGKTDSLIKKALFINENPSARELDALISIGEQESASLLAMALEKIGLEATSLSGPQAGIYTCETHCQADISSINTSPIKKILALNKIVIVTGFQGLSPKGNLCTLGRGGSDLSAIALAHYFNAEKCQLFKDTGSLYTQDPFLFKNAQTIPYIDYQDCEILVQNGARIIQDKALQYAKIHNVCFEICSHKNGQTGTFIGPPTLVEMYAR